MKIICVDNFNRESITDDLVCTNVSEYYGEYIVDFLNKKFGGDNSFNFYRLVNDDYKLWKGMEELV